MNQSLLLLLIAFAFVGCTVRYERLPDPRPGTARYLVEITVGAGVEVVP